MRKTLTLTVLLVFLASVITINGVVVKPSKMVPLLVGFKDKPDEDLIRTYGGKISYEHTLISAISCELPESSIDALKSNSKVAYVEEDGIANMMGEVLPWSIDRIDAEIVHTYNKGTGVNISIIDTGIDYTHPDLDLNIVGGKSFVDYTTDYMDDNGHGTLVAGIIAAEDNEIGIIGVAPESNLYALKVLDSQGSGYISNIVAAIEWSINNSMQIISMSIGTTFNYESLRTVCDKAYAAGLLIVAAGGNDATTWSVRFDWNTINYPARYDSVIAVGATNSNDLRASWSSTGSELELVAPGVNINSTYLNSMYATYSGTSLACPHVTGTAALIFNTLVDPDYDLDGDGDWDAVEVRQKLQDTAEDLGDLGRDLLYGYGLVEAAPDFDTKPPTISAVNSLDMVTNVTISWITDEPSDSKINYGTTKLLENTISNITLVTNHSITLTGLSPEMTYYYEVCSTDLTGNTAIDDNGGLYYAFRDKTPPSTINDLTTTVGAFPNIHLTWTSATDNVGVDHYNIFRSQTGTINKTTDFLTTYISEITNSYTDSTGTTETTYYYAVCAVDAADNEAALSNIVSARVTEPTMHVLSIDMSTETINIWRWSWTRAFAVLTIVDVNGNPVEGATVSGHGSGLTSGVASGETNATGQVILKSRYVFGASGTFVFTIDNIEKIGWTYDLTKNEKTSESITV